MSASRPRRDCQEGYLQQYANVAPVPDQPTVIERKPESQWSLGESALAFRLGAILESDYFVPSVVEYGRISHGLPLIVDASRKPVTIMLDSQSSTIAPILQLYETDYAALTGFVKDFIRNAIFQKVSTLVPSSTRDGAAAFLKSIQRPRDLFEYEHTDLGTLSEIWYEYTEGRITMIEAARQSASIARSTLQILEPASASTVEEVLSDVIANERIMADIQLDDELTALPAITRPDLESTAKLFLVGEGLESFRGYRGFLALTDRVRRENTDFFLQPQREPDTDALSNRNRMGRSKSTLHIPTSFWRVQPLLRVARSRVVAQWPRREPDTDVHYHRQEPSLYSHPRLSVGRLQGRTRRTKKFRSAMRLAVS